MATAIEELVTNVLETRFEAFSDETIEDAKRRIIDVVGCAIGGANASGNSMILDLVRGWGGRNEATILVHGDRVPVHNAAMVNCIMCRSYDYEAGGPEAEGASGRLTVHICGTTDSTGLSVAEYRGSDGKELIAAVILGGDMAARIACAEDFAFQHSFESTGTINAFGATAVAGRLYGLNQRQMVNAFGILVNEIAGSFQSVWDGVHTFKLPQGLSARNAILAIELARRGFTGVKDPLLSPGGYFPQYCKSYHPEFLTKELGKVFYTKGQHKIYPSCYGNHTAIECGLKILSQYDIKGEDIDEVTLYVTQSRYDSFLNQPFEAGDSEQKALFNISYAVANVLMRKGAKLEHYTDAFVRDPKVLELVKRVKVVPTLPPGNKQAIDLKVKTKDGREFSAHADNPRGWLENPITKGEIEDKFWANVAFSKTVSRKRAEKALVMLANLQEVDNVAKIVDLLVT